MASSDLKDGEILRLRQEITQLNRQITERTLNYLNSVSGLRGQTKVVYVLNSQQQAEQTAERQQHEEQPRELQQQTTESVRRLEMLLSEKVKELAKRNQEIVVLREQLSVSEATVRELQENNPIGKENASLSASRLADLQQAVNINSQALNIERIRSQRLQTENDRLALELTIERTKLLNQANDESKLRETNDRLAYSLRQEKQRREREHAELKQSFQTKLRDETASLVSQLESLKSPGKKLGQKGSMTEGELKMKEELKEKLRTIEALQTRVKQLESQQSEPVLTFDSESDLETYKKKAEEDRQLYQSRIADLTNRMQQEIDQANSFKQNSVEAATTIAELQANVKALTQQLENRESQHSLQTNRLISDISKLNHQNQQNIDKIVQRDESLISQEQSLRELHNHNRDLQVKLGEARSIMDDINRTVAALKEKVRYLEVENQGLREAQQRAIQLKTDVEVQLAAARKEITRLEDKIQEEAKHNELRKSENLLAVPEDRLRRSMRLTEQIKELTKNSTEKDSKLVEYLKRENDTLKEETEELTAQLKAQQKRAERVESELREELKKQMEIIETLSAKVHKLEEDQRLSKLAKDQLLKQRELAQKQTADRVKQLDVLRGEMEELEKENILLKGRVASSKNERESTQLTEEYYTQSMIQLADEKKALEAKVSELTELLHKQKDAHERELKELNRQREFRTEGDLRPVSEGELVRGHSAGQRATFGSKNDELKEVIERLSKEDLRLKQINSTKHNNPRVVQNVTHSAGSASPDISVARKRKMTNESSESYPIAEGEQIGLLQSELEKTKRELSEKIAHYQQQMQQVEEDCRSRLTKKNKKLLELEATMEQQQGRIAELTGQMEQQDKLIHELSQESESLRNQKSNKLEKLISHINEIEERNSQLLEELKANNELKDKLKEDSTAAEKNFAELLKKSTDETDAVRTQLAQVSKQLSSKLEEERQKASIPPQIVVSTDTQTDPNDLNQELLVSAPIEEARSPVLPPHRLPSRLSEHCGNLTPQELDMVGTKLAELERENQRLQAQLREMLAQKKDLENQLSMYEIRLSTTNFSSEKQLKRKNTQISAANEEVEALKKEVGRLNQANTDLEVEKMTLEDQIAEMERSSQVVVPKKEEKPQSKPQRRDKSKTPSKQQTRLKTEEHQQSAEQRKASKQLNEKVNQAVKKYIEVNEQLNMTLLELEKERSLLTKKLEDANHQHNEDEKALETLKRQNENLEEIGKRLRKEVDAAVELNRSKTETASAKVSELESKIREMEAAHYKDNESRTALRQTAPPSLQVSKPPVPAVDVVKLEEEIRSLTEQLTKQKQEFESFREAVRQTSEKSNLAAREKAESYRQYVVSLNQTIASMKKQQEEATKKAAEAADSYAAELKEKIRKLESQIETLAQWEQRYNKSEQSLKETSNTITSLRQQIIHLDGIILEWKKTNTDLEEQNKARLRDLSVKSETEDELKQELKQREAEIRSLETQLHDILSHQSQLMLKAQTREEGRLVQTLRQRIASLEKEGSEMRSVLESELPPLYEQILTLQNNKIEEDKLTKELEMSCMLDRLTIQQLEQRIKEYQQEEKPVVSGCAENLQSEKRILREIEEIERVKKERQEEVDRVTQLYQTQLSAKNEELAAKEKELEISKKNIEGLTERHDDIVRKNSDLHAQLEQQQKKHQAVAAVKNNDVGQAAQLAKELSTLRAAYSFVEKRRHNYEAVIEEAENDKMQMFKEMEQYKATMEKTLSENKTLRVLAQQTADTALKHREKQYADFKQFAEITFQQQLQLQKRVDRLTKDHSTKEKELAERNKELVSLQTEVRELRRAIKLDPTAYEYYSPSPCVDEQASSFANLSANFRKDMDRKNSVMAADDHYVRRVDSMAPSVGRADNAELARYEREYNKLKQDLHSCNVQLTTLRINFEASEKERQRLTLSQQSLEKDVETFRAVNVSLQEELEFQRKRHTNEFAQFVNKIVSANWKIISEPTSGLRPRRISLDRSTHDLTVELKRQEETFKEICAECYQIFQALPVTSTDNLFEPETKEDLMSILRDIRSFSGSYKQREVATALERGKRDDTYNDLVMGLIQAGMLEEERMDELLAHLSKEDFEGLLKRVKAYYKKQRQQVETPKLGPTPTANRSSKKVGFSEEIELNPNNFKSLNSQEFFDMSEPANLQILSRKEAELNQCTIRLREAEQKLKQQEEALSLQQTQIEQLKRAEQRCAKEHRKGLLVQKGREYE